MGNILQNKAVQSFRLRNVRAGGRHLEYLL